MQRQFGYSDDVLRNQIVKTDDLDAEAAFLHNLIPPKEESNEKDKAHKNLTDIEQENDKNSGIEKEVASELGESEVNKEEKI